MAFQRMIVMPVAKNFTDKACIANRILQTQIKAAVKNLSNMYYSIVFLSNNVTFALIFARCQWCPKTYEQLEGLRRHIRQHVGDEKFVCKDCGKKFITSIQLKRHLWLSHDQDSPYRRSIL